MMHNLALAEAVAPDAPDKPASLVARGRIAAFIADDVNAAA